MKMCGIFQIGNLRVIENRNTLRQEQVKAKGMVDLHKDRIVIAIHAGKRVENIFKLPCVRSCYKCVDGKVRFQMFAWDKYGNYIEACEGDWICKLSDGRWIVLDDNRYRNVLVRSGRRG